MCINCGTNVLSDDRAFLKNDSERALSYLRKYVPTIKNWTEIFFKIFSYSNNRRTIVFTKLRRNNCARDSSVVESVFNPISVDRKIIAILKICALPAE